MDAYRPYHNKDEQWLWIVDRKADTSENITFPCGP